jgi:serine-type D-Ala-D-Ala carboxypeptidase (penicillin-binding protein 5/6)
MNADTGVILFEKNAHALQYPASVTKVATAVYALKVAGNKLDTKIEADHDSVASISEELLRKSNYTKPAYWLIPGGTHIGIKKGEILTLKDLLYGLMLASGNDAANVIAKHIGGTIPDFMKQVNSYLKGIGCKQTTFYNPHGLYFPKHQTTAYDLAMIMKEGLKNPQFCEIIATKQYTRPKTNKQESSTLVQTNRLIRKGKNYYAKALGGKTGYLSVAGHTFVAAARHDGRTLIAVLLKTKERAEMFQDAIKMFDAAFNQPKSQKILFKKGLQTFILEIPGAAKPIITYIEKEVAIEYYPGEDPKLKCFLQWGAKKLPVNKGQMVGELHLQTEAGKTLSKIPLFASEDVSASWWRRILP